MLCGVNPLPVITRLESDRAGTAIGESCLICGTGLTTSILELAIRETLVGRFPSRAETVTQSAGGITGAVYVPLLSIEPLVLSPPTTPLTVHSTRPRNGEANA